jgi:hypothetical protein
MGETIAPTMEAPTEPPIDVIPVTESPTMGVAGNSSYEY